MYSPSRDSWQASSTPQRSQAVPDPEPLPEGVVDEVDPQDLLDISTWSTAAMVPLHVQASIGWRLLCFRDGHLKEAKRLRRAARKDERNIEDLWDVRGRMSATLDDLRGWSVHMQSDLTKMRVLTSKLVQLDADIARARWEASEKERRATEHEHYAEIISRQLLHDETTSATETVEG